VPTGLNVARRGGTPWLSSRHCRAWATGALGLSAVLAACSDSITENPLQLSFTSTPATTALHNEEYRYPVSAQGGAAALRFSAPTLPDWLTFDTATHILSGTATADRFGEHSVVLSVSDAVATATQSFTVTVSLHEVPGGSWVGHFPYDWPHDGHPLVGATCDVYSDAVDDNVKAAYLARAEADIAELVAAMEMEPATQFHFPPGRSKIDLYVNRLHTEYGGGFTYHGGAIVLAPDHPNFRPGQGWCVNQVEHELMHVVETLIDGSDYLDADVWFREGIADYFAGNAEITSVEELDAWLAPRSALPGGGNPIQIHLWDDFPDAVTHANAQGSWYVMFELAVRYLMSERGLGRSYPDVRDLFLDMGGGASPFRTAFEAHIGIGLTEFEEEFFQRVRTYLDDRV